MRASTTNAEADRLAFTTSRDFKENAASLKAAGAKVGDGVENAGEGAGMVSKKGRKIRPRTGSGTSFLARGLLACRVEARKAGVADG